MRASSAERSPVSATLIPNRSVNVSTTAAASGNTTFSVAPSRWMERWRSDRLHLPSAVTREAIRLVTKCDDGWVEAYQLPTFKSIGGAALVENSYNGCHSSRISASI